MTKASVFPLPVTYKTRKLILYLTETITIDRASDKVIVNEAGDNEPITQHSFTYRYVITLGYI